MSENRIIALTVLLLLLFVLFEMHFSWKLGSEIMMRFYGVYNVGRSQATWIG